MRLTGSPETVGKEFQKGCRKEGGLEGQTATEHGRALQVLLSWSNYRQRLRGICGGRRRRSREGKAQQKTKPLALGAARGFGAIVDSGLLSHMTLCSIIGDGELNFRVRNGIGCTLSSMATKEIRQIY